VYQEVATGAVLPEAQLDEGLARATIAGVDESEVVPEFRLDGELYSERVKAVLDETRLDASYVQLFRYLIDKLRMGMCHK
jgi:hypothetical protein